MKYSHFFNRFWQCDLTQLKGIAASGMLVICCLLCFCWVGPTKIAAQVPDTVFRIAKLEVTGLQKLSPEQFFEIGQLKLGQPVKLADMNSVIDRLYATNKFAQIRYRYAWKGDQLDLFFQAEEATLPPPPVALPAQPTVKTVPTLGKVEFKGLQRCDRVTTLSVTALRLGAPFDKEQLNVAAKKLIQTGYFTEIDYSFAWEGDQANVLFDVIEAKWNGKVFFDNFVWFSSAELATAIRQEIPLFEGALPDNLAIVERVTAILDNLLQQRGIPRKTSYLVSGGDLVENTARDHVFIAAGAPMPICQVRFPGATSNIEKQLNAAAKPFLGGDYSFSHWQGLKGSVFGAFYRQKGYLRATLADVQAQLENGNKKCSGGVSLVIPVTENVAYRLGTFEWKGNQVIGNLALQDLLGMKKAAVADGAKIDKGIAAIKEEYWEKGYLDLKVTVRTDYVSSENLANFQILVDEGQPYRMGELILKNASESEQKRLRAKWQLALGAPMNVAQLREFARKQFEPSRGRVPDLQLRRDTKKHIADVVITY